MKDITSSDCPQSNNTENQDDKLNHSIAIEVGVKLSQVEVLTLFNHFDDSSEVPLHEGLDFKMHSRKFADKAYFILAKSESQIIGFVAYYLNEEGKFAYISEIIVHKNGRHRGLGHTMMLSLTNSLGASYNCIRLEVLKTNEYAKRFYEREGFYEIDDHVNKFLLEKVLQY